MTARRCDGHKYGTVGEDNIVGTRNRLLEKKSAPVGCEHSMQVERGRIAIWLYPIKKIVN